MKYNEAFMERIQAAKSSKELLNIRREMAEGSFLNWYVNPAMPEEAVKDFEAIGKEPNGLEKQKRLLAELLDKNQFYVNLSEIDDVQFKVSEEDKALNKAFYGGAYHVFGRQEFSYDEWSNDNRSHMGGALCLARI